MMIGIRALIPDEYPMIVPELSPLVKRVGSKEVQRQVWGLPAFRARMLWLRVLLMVAALAIAILARFAAALVFPEHIANAVMMFLLMIGLMFGARTTERLALRQLRPLIAEWVRSGVDIASRT